MRHVKLALGFAWALPTTLVGLLLAVLGGARPYALRPAGAWWWTPWQSVCGWAWMFGPGKRWGAITLGHVTIGREDCANDSTTVRHERIHLTRQQWAWGPLFLPMYGLEYLLEVAMCGADAAYRAIPFEVEAYAKQSTPDEWG